MSPNDVRRLSKRMSTSELQLHACAYVHVCADNITHTYMIVTGSSENKIISRRIEREEARNEEVCFISTNWNFMLFSIKVDFFSFIME